MCPVSWRGHYSRHVFLCSSLLEYYLSYLLSTLNAATTGSANQLKPVGYNNHVENAFYATTAWKCRKNGNASFCVPASNEMHSMSVRDLDLIDLFLCFATTFFYTFFRVQNFSKNDQNRRY